ncbi:MAG TPA: hypothetical protein VE861_11665, partial [Gemmatimonadaceae bacterium]|nr:hypothetical protein [Gemmatimonadaceae bacterium]
MIGGWLPAVLLAGGATIAPPAGGVFHDVRGTAATVTAKRTHDFHVSYTRMAIEPTVISAQIRLFTDDMTRALVERSRQASITLNSP